jgi:dTDP-4-amino-4,6-dideoxygalactose transaminase
MSIAKQRDTVSKTNGLAQSRYSNAFTIKAFTSATLDKDDVAVARQCLADDSRWHDRDTVIQFEKAFATWNGSKHAFAFMHGRIALSACLYALGVTAGDEVIIPGYTCIAVPNALSFMGIKIVYSDIELDTYGLDASLLEAKITSKTRVILLHHLYGLVCRDYEAILAVAAKYGLKTIEDCAHSTGAEYNGIKVGNRADAGFYSTQKSKVITTIEGGLAVTNHDGVAQKLQEYYDQAMEPDQHLIGKLLNDVIIDYYRFRHPMRRWIGPIVQKWYKKIQTSSITPEEMTGRMPDNYNQKMPAPIAAIGINQLKKIDALNDRRRQTALKWNHWCDEHKYRKPLVVAGSLPVFVRYPVLAEATDKSDTGRLQDELHVNIGVWFISHVHPVGWEVKGCPSARIAIEQCINLPCL